MRHKLLALFCGAVLALPASASAAPSVTAVLSNSEVVVGEMVQMEIRLTDAGSASVPSDIRVDGLEIHQTGTSQQFEMRNFTTTSTRSYNYTVLPLRAGAFTIPSQTVRVGGNTYQTPELTLRVSGAAGGQNPPNTAGGGAPQSYGTLAFAELIVPKKTAYVGEMIPVVARLCFATRAKLEPPELTAQGFTVQKLQPPEDVRQEIINGQKWAVYSFKTAIAATRPGKFEIGPIESPALVAVPLRGTSRSRSALDIFRDDPFFSDPFFADPFGNRTQQQRITVRSEPVTLEIKPLPANAPPNFSGAVGNFTMASDAKPTQVQVGDPITVTATVSGRGNFDRVAAPVLEDDAGWHKYPPSAKFKQDDDVGISGQKTFESVISPNEAKTTVPPLTFAYFDPAKEQYITLRSDAVPIRVTGAAAATASKAAGSSTPAPAPVVAATPPPRDILYQLTSRPSTIQSFTPLYQQRAFWLAQLIPLACVLAGILWRIRTTRLEDRDARRVAALQNEVADLTRKLRRSDITPNEYFPQASRLVQIKTALARNLDPNAVDAETAARTFDLDEAERAKLRQIFEQSDELRYSGSGNGNGHVSPEQSREILQFIERLRA